MTMFRWQALPYGRKGFYCDVKGGRLKVEKFKGRRVWQVLWNGSEIAIAMSDWEAKGKGEELYNRGLL